ncbi:MAG TPA: TonB-dependent receptor [Luteitalea sp.]|nr:TonB-dependent receptor [Luteitalea sp.]
MSPRGVLVAALIVSLALAPAARAQQPTPPTPPSPGQPAPVQPPSDDGDEEEPLEAEETVVVSATRSGRRIQDEPLRVEVINAEEIEEKALMTPGSVAMLLGETTGLRVQTTAPSLGAANVRVQGLRGRYAQLLADGLPLYGGSDSFGLLQVPPLDLGQVEVIKGAASALYGPAALGGVINLVTRRPTEAHVDALFNATTLQGADATVFVGRAPVRGWSGTLLGGVHTQERLDRDDDRWTDVAGYRRGVVRPRLFYDSGTGRSMFLTTGLIVENREAGTIDGGTAPDGSPFAERLETRRADVGGQGRWLAGERVVTVRGSFSHNGQHRWFGDLQERGTRRTAFGEASVSGVDRGHTWVIGTAVQQDRYAPRDVSRFAYAFTAPAVFAQDQVSLGEKVSVSASARLDQHSEYGSLFGPRVSVLIKPSPTWTARVSSGGGTFAPTPFTEETDETGLARLAALDGLEAERAWSFSADLTWTRGPFEITGTGFASHVRNPVHLATLGRSAQLTIPCAPYGCTSVALVNASSPTRTWGTELLARYRRGAFVAMATHAWTRSTEWDVDDLVRRDVALTPRHAVSLNAMVEGEDWGRAGIEAYYTGRQSLDDNPYRAHSRGYVLFGGLFERRFGRLRLFANVENLANVRQTRHDPLVRPTRQPDGRWTVEAWAPLDGRVLNGGMRIAF